MPDYMTDRLDFISQQFCFKLNIYFNQVNILESAISLAEHALLFSTKNERLWNNYPSYLNFLLDERFIFQKKLFVFILK